MLSKINEPPKAAIDDFEHDYWKNPNGLMQGKLLITATHPAWLSHLKKDMKWKSTAHDPCEEYLTCIPFKPCENKKVDDAAYSMSKGFIPIPQFFVTKKPYDRKLDEVLHIPSYSVSAYEAIDKIKKDACIDADYTKWIGKTVMWSFF